MRLTYSSEMKTSQPSWRPMRKELSKYRSRRAPSRVPTFTCSRGAEKRGCGPVMGLKAIIRPVAAEPRSLVLFPLRQNVAGGCFGDQAVGVLAQQESLRDGLLGRGLDGIHVP